jgi:hypothetical protein
MKNQFDKKYWDTLYKKEKGVIIEGIDDAKSRAKYLHSFFELEQFYIDSILDIGFGKAKLLKEIYKTFSPSILVGLEPSQYIFHKLLLKQKSIKLHNLSFLEYNSNRVYDLGICNSVLQYIADKEMNSFLKKMATFCRFVYITVPTTEEYKLMQTEVRFFDPYSFSRSKLFYKTIIQKYFRIISHSILESKLLHKSSVIRSDLFTLE